jgi:hypothetical protein
MAKQSTPAYVRAGQHKGYNKKNSYAEMQRKKKIRNTVIAIAAVVVLATIIVLLSVPLGSVWGTYINGDDFVKINADGTFTAKLYNSQMSKTENYSGTYKMTGKVFTFIVGSRQYSGRLTLENDLDISFVDSTGCCPLLVTLAKLG